MTPPPVQPVIRKRIYDLVYRFIHQHGIPPSHLILSHELYDELLREMEPFMVRTISTTPLGADITYDGMKVRRVRKADTLSVALVLNEADPT